MSASVHARRCMPKEKAWAEAWAAAGAASCLTTETRTARDTLLKAIYLTTQVVFIGKNLNRKELHEGLKSCLAVEAK